MEYDKRFADRALKRVADAELDLKVRSCRDRLICWSFVLDLQSTAGRYNIQYLVGIFDF